MKKSGLVVVSALMWALLTGVSPAQTEPTDDDPATQDETALVTISYEELEYSQPDLDEARAALINNGALEELQRLLSPLRLPEPLRITASQCGADRREYDPGNATVTICYEEVARILGVAGSKFESGSPEKRYFVTGVVIATLLSEVAYGLFDILDIPIWGRVEDAADRLSAFLMVQFGEDVATATYFSLTNYLAWTHVPPTDAEIRAGGSPQMQRYYNVSCILVVGNPVDVVPVASQMPEDLYAPSRFGRCAAEYEQVRQAFNLRIMPFIDPDKLISVRASGW